MIKTLFLAGSLLFAPIVDVVETTPPTSEVFVQKTYVFNDEYATITLTLVDETNCTVVIQEQGKETTENKAKYVKDGQTVTLINDKGQTLVLYVDDENGTLLPNFVEEETLKDKITALEEYIKTQYDKIANMELVAGLSIGGLITVCITALGALARYKLAKKKDIIQENRYNSFNERLDKSLEEFEEFRKFSIEYIDSMKEEVTNLKNECAELIKDTKEALPELKQYEKFNERLLATLNALEQLSLDPMFVKSGVSEKVRDVIDGAK